MDADYNPRLGSPVDVKHLASDLEAFIAKLPHSCDPERPRRELRRLSIHQLRSEQIESVVREYAEGATMLKIGEWNNVNRQTVSKALRQAGIALRR